MQNALGLMGDQALMIAITTALGVAGILALFMALFWPTRWRLKYRMEVGFVVILGALMIFADFNSTETFTAYEKDLPREGEINLANIGEAGLEKFDRTYGVYAFQWGFIFFDENNAASRNAVKVAPGERVLFNIMANDVIHGFSIPVVGITTEFQPGEVRSIWIRAPEKEGKYLIQCMNYCGLGHSQMKAWLVVDKNFAPMKMGSATQGAAETGGASS